MPRKLTLAELEQRNEAQRDNQRRLCHCQRHVFKLIPDSTKSMCSLCGGSVGSVARWWYEQGLRHGAAQNGFQRFGQPKV